jgi:hypothetical protein
MAGTWPCNQALLLSRDLSAAAIFSRILSNSSPANVITHLPLWEGGVHIQELARVQKYLLVMQAISLILMPPGQRNADDQTIGRDSVFPVTTMDS